MAANHGAMPAGSDGGAPGCPNIGDEYWVYAVGPIDWWTGWRPLRDLEITAYDSHTLLHAFEEAARLVDWEGDKRVDWQVAPMPCPDRCTSLAMFAFKQDNNGTTFIFSPVPLRHLEDASYDSKPARVRVRPTVIGPIEQP